MRFVKVVIDGKEYYRMEDENKGKGADTIEGEFVEVEIEAPEGEADAGSAKRFFVKVGEGFRDFGERVARGAKGAYVKISGGARELGVKIKDGCERLFEKDKSEDPNSKEAKLLKLLPYMSAEEAHLVCEQLLANDEVLLKLDISAVMPFLSAEDCDKMFEKRLSLGGGELAKAMQYISTECKTRFVEGYIAGKHQDVNIDELYPFLDDAQIKMLFYNIVNAEQ